MPAPVEVKRRNATSIVRWMSGGIVLLVVLLIAGAVFLFKSSFSDESPNYADEPVSAQVAPAVGWVQVTDSQSRLAFDVPAHWRDATEVVPGSDALIDSSPDVEQVRAWLAGDGVSEPLMLVSVFASTDPVPLPGKIHAESFLLGVEATAGPLTVEDSAAITTSNGLVGHWITYRISVSGDDADGAVVALTHGTTAFILSVTAYESDVDPELINEIVETVRID